MKVICDECEEDYKIFMCNATYLAVSFSRKSKQGSKTVKSELENK